MKISLVIATYNRGPSIEGLLLSLSKQTLAKSDWQVVVVDDGSSDDTAFRLQKIKGIHAFNFIHLHQSNAGAAVARDRGIRTASGQRVVITDDDMELSPDFLSAHLAAAANDPKSTVVLGAIRPTDNWTTKPLFDVVGEFRLAARHQEFISKNINPEPWELVTGNVSYPRELYLAVGGFNSSLRLWEDLELGHRLGRIGAKIVFSSQAWTVHHSDIGDYDRWLKRQFNHGSAAVQVWQANHCDINLHPLANLLKGHALKRTIVMTLCRWEFSGQAAISSLAMAGNILQKSGFLRLGIAAYQLIESLAFHLGLKRHYGSWGKVMALIKS